MRMPLGKLGGPIPSVGSFSHAATLFLLISAAFSLVLPKIADAQVWISSRFTVTPGSQTVTATCSTSAVNPATGQNSPAATDYLQFSAYCDVISSTTPAQIFTSAQCPRPAPGYDPAGSSATGSPMASCSVVFQPQPGVTYTISSGHDIWYNIFPDCYISSGIQMPCYADPEGFYAAGIVRANTQSTSITQEVTGTGAAMNYKPPFQQPLAFASSSAIYTPCPTPQITSVSPSTWIAGQTYNPVTITGTGFTTTANATRLVL